MIDLLAAAPGRAETARRIAIPTLVAVIASALVTSLATFALSGADASRTLTVAELWRIAFPISVLAPAVVCPILALHMGRLLRDLRRAREMNSPGSPIRIRSRACSTVAASISPRPPPSRSRAAPISPSSR